MSYSFESFYQESHARLLQKNAAYNAQLAQEKHPLLRAFSEEFVRMNGGGKMLRAMLVNLGYKLAGGKDLSQSDDLALAFELFQTAVLIHDDVIDKAETRRDKVTIHRCYEDSLKDRKIRMVSATESEASLGASAAICIGDLGLYYANQKVAQGYCHHPKLGELIGYFNQVIIDTIRGELLDVILPYELQDEKRSDEERRALLKQSVMEIYHLKTAYYSVIGPLHLGTLLGEMDEGDRARLDEICDDLGIAFQIKDDLLGVFSESEEIGKDVGSDISEFKQTILYMYVMSMAPSYAPSLLQYYGKGDLTPEQLAAVRSIFVASGAYDYAVSMMESCFERAQVGLNAASFINEEDRNILEGFICYLRDRRK